MVQPLKYTVPGEMVAKEDPHAERTVPVEEDSAYGWNPYRGAEAHGVAIKGGYPEDLDETIEETYKDYEEPRREDIKSAPSVSTVRGWDEQQLVRIVATDSRLPLPTGQWVKLLEYVPRRTTAYFWFDPAPEAGHRIYFQNGSKDKPPALCPSITNGGQQVGLYPLETTDELWVMADNPPAAGGTYMVNVIEEKEIKA